jgi:hypothetical protein
MAADAIHLVLQSLLDHSEPVPVDQAAEPEHRPIRETLTVQAIFPAGLTPDEVTDLR